MLGAGRDNHQECLWAISSLNRTLNQHISNTLTCIEKNMKGLDLGRWSIANGNKLLQERCTERFFGWWKFEIHLPKSFPQLLSPQNITCRNTTKTREPIICPWGYASFQMVFPLHTSKTPCDLFVLLFIPWCLKVFQITSCLYPEALLPLLEMSPNIYMQFDSKEAFRSCSSKAPLQKKRTAFLGPSFHRVTYPAEDTRGCHGDFSRVFFLRSVKIPGIDAEYPK